MMLEITGYVMKAAPLAVFAAIAATVTTNGLGILVTFGKFMGGFYLSLVVLWVVIFGAGFLVIGPRAFRLAHLVREPILLAFSTASSEAAYPKTLERLEQFGVPNRIASFVLPLGYSFNLDGSMMYCTFATLFIAQAYGITLELGRADHHAAAADADLEGHGGRAARLAGGDLGDALDLQHSGGRAVAHHGHRPVPRHGTQRHQRGRQFGGGRRDRQVGRQPACRSSPASTKARRWSIRSRPRRRRNRWPP